MKTAAITVLPLTPDPVATVRFSESKLGFRCRYQQEGLAILVRDDMELHFTKCSDQRPIDWSCCRIRVDDIETLYAEYSAVLAIHANGKLRDTEYGTREFGIIDENGVLLRFFEERT